MRLKQIVPILILSGLWGFSEAFIGDMLYTHSIPAAGIMLSVIAFAILCISRSFVLFPGSAVLIASVAMLYKFLNEPFYPCHLLGIFMLGLSFEFFFSLLWPKRKIFAPTATAYCSYAGFAIFITYVFRYSHWVEKGTSEVLQYIFLQGTICAILFILTAPVFCSLGSYLRNTSLNTNFVKLSPAISTASIILLWGLLISPVF